MYVYNENGILVDRILYRDLAAECGKPVSISENGLYLLFKKSDLSPDIFLINVSITGFTLCKSINIP